jgi:ATP-dependent DNA helicase RecG
MEVTTPAQFLPGVGPRRASLLAKVGIRTVWDLLWHLPRSWSDRTHLTPLTRLVPGLDQTSRGVVLDAGAVPAGRARGLFEVTLRDAGGTASAVWFHAPFLSRQILPGQEILVSGPVRLHDRQRQFVHPEYEIIASEADAPALTGGRIVPIYPLTAGLTQKMLRTWIRLALDQVGSKLIDPLPPESRERLGLPELSWAIERVHFPQAGHESEAARDCLAFHEFMLLQLAFGLVRRARAHPRTARPLRSRGTLAGKLRAALPFRLTQGQEGVLREILVDLERDRPMNRLLQGDVGSGKTVVAALACLAAAEAGEQAVYLAPTEILARQQTRLLQEWFEPLGVQADGLVGKTRSSERRRILAGLSAGEIQIVVGTHALLEDPVAFHRLGLVVVDEQHRFGVLQRARLREKGPWPHCLVMSATPIPRTLSLTLHGDLDVSTLREMPAGRLPPRTRLVEQRKRDDLIRWVGRCLRQGERAFFIYPLVEESEQLDLRDATRMADTLAQHPGLAGIRVGLLHGRMKSEEKERAMAAFREGSAPCLVATTVVEVGVDVPKATIMVVEHPERFGLSQLHQLRGRVGRGGGVSHVFLMKPSGGGPGLKRLRVLVRESDGFRVAEEDLRLRGPGDLLGTAQHGLPELKAADLIQHPAILLRARDEAQRIQSADPSLTQPVHAPLRRDVLQRFGARMSLLDVG